MKVIKLKFSFVYPSITILFFIWILPLGIFIKPSQEKIACGGQRAICLCSHKPVLKTEHKALPTGIFLTRAAASQEEGLSGGMNHYNNLNQYLNMQVCQRMVFFKDQYLRYKNPFFISIEHIPKSLLA